MNENPKGKQIEYKPIFKIHSETSLSKDRTHKWFYLESCLSRSSWNIDSYTFNVS